MKYEVILTKGNIVDGSGSSSYTADIAIKDGKIAKIGNLDALDAERIIDVNGFVIAPGFIDIHAHNDGYLFIDNSAMYKLAQGVTTEISGNCGEGLAPVNAKYQKEIDEYYKSYYPPENFSDFVSYQYFFKRIEDIRKGINVGFHCAHGTLRMASMGFAERSPDSRELKVMKDYLREGMENGALGLSTGLVYSPGCFAGKEEIIELCKVVSEYGGVYATHLRSEGMYLVESVKEAIEIGRASNVQVILSHHKALGRTNWGKSKETLQLIAQANKDGVRISLDQYPYTSSCAVLLWAIPVQYTEGGIGKMIERLKDPAIRQAIRKEYFSPDRKWDNPIENIGCDGILVLTAQNVPEAEGKTVAQYAEEISQDPIDTLFDIIIESGGNSLAGYHSMCESDLTEIMKYPGTMIASDGIPVMPGEKTHPRVCGTFPRILGRYVREKKILSLEDAIRRMTSLPASTIGLVNKGLIKEGYDADITVFDKDTIIDCATFDNFSAKPEGIKYVFVNGRIALENGQYTYAESGKLIRKLKRR